MQKLQIYPFYFIIAIGLFQQLQWSYTWLCSFVRVAYKDPIIIFDPNPIVKLSVAAAPVPITCKLNPVCEKEELEGPFWLEGMSG